MPTQDEFRQHEVLHTASIVMMMWDAHICETRYVEADAEVKAAAQKAHDALFDFYQLVGAKTLGEKGGPAN